MHSFFISANSKNGFYSLYDKVFDNRVFDKIFVIFGGPGTGKSTLMRRISASAVKKGAEAELFYCSSDIHSLDGVILSKGERRVGILDGTPPHARTITSPAVKEELWDISRFWDTGILTASGALAETAFVAKKQAYRRAYAFLSAAGTLHEEGVRLAADTFSFHKARQVAKRRVHTLTVAGVGKERLIRCYAMQGEALVSDWCKGVENIILLRGNPYSAENYISVFEEVLKEENREYILLRSPLNPERGDGLFFPATKTLICKEELAKETLQGRGVHLSAFDTGGENKKQIKHLLKEERALTKEAELALARAGEHHFCLEKLFSSAMDFPRMQKEAMLWEKQLLGALGLV